MSRNFLSSDWNSIVPATRGEATGCEAVISSSISAIQSLRDGTTPQAAVSLSLKLSEVCGNGMLSSWVPSRSLQWAMHLCLWVSVASGSAQGGLSPRPAMAAIPASHSDLQGNVQAEVQGVELPPVTEVTTLGVPFGSVDPDLHLAQRLPQSEDFQDLEEPEIEPLPPIDELLPPRDSSDPTPSNLDEIPGTIEVRGYRVVGSMVFEQQEFDELLADLTGPEIRFAQLLEARTRITDLYVENRYITSGAFLPPQTIEDGIVEIQVIEGSLEEIVITGTDRLRPHYIRSRIERATDAPLNVDDLLEALQLLQLDPLIENLSAELSAGLRPGSNLLEVEIGEADSFSTSLRFDNGRSPTVGVLRGRIGLNEANLFGLGDMVDLSYSATDGSDEYALSYTLPLNSSNATLSASARLTSSQIIEEPFDRIDIEADSRDFELTFRQPILRSPREELAVGLTFSRRESDTSLLGVGFPLSNGANDDGETRISAFRFFQEWTKRESRSVFAARSQFNWGIPIFESTLNNQKPDSRFFSWRTQAQYLQLLGTSDISLLLRGDLQLSTTSMVALEQFGVGGNRSVRGYSQDLLLADNGIFGSAELRFPLIASRDGSTQLEIHPFFDFGTVWNTDSEDPSPDSLASIGVGLSFDFNDILSAKLDWGIPLTEVDNRDRDIIERQELYFSLEWRPF
jgi:hemolysin activation/secretion protein